MVTQLLTSQLYSPAHRCSFQDSWLVKRLPENNTQHANVAVLAHLFLSERHRWSVVWCIYLGAVILIIHMWTNVQVWLWVKTLTPWSRLQNTSITTSTTCRWWECDTSIGICHFFAGGGGRKRQVVATKPGNTPAKEQAVAWVNGRAWHLEYQRWWRLSLANRCENIAKRSFQHNYDCFDVHPIHNPWFCSSHPLVIFQTKHGKNVDVSCQEIKTHKSTQ